MTSRWLAVLSLVLAIGAPVGYMLALRVPLVRNHPEGYVVALVVATVLAALAVRRASRRRAVAWAVLGLTTVLLIAGAWFNFVGAHVPTTATALHVGERPPDFTLIDASGRAVSLADYRGQKPVVVIFYRGYW